MSRTIQIHTGNQQLVTNASASLSASGLIGGSSNYIPLWTNATAQSSSVIYQNSNNIGIGTINPSATLHVSSSAQELSRFQSSNTLGAYTTWYNGSIASLFAGYGTTLSSNATNNDGVIRYNSSYNLIFSRDGAEAARFNSSGNFGINVTPNNAKLEVVATSGEVFRADAASGAYRIVANQTGVMMNGNVGIGTTSPSAKLEVIGNALIGQKSNSSTAARLDITAGGNGYDAVIDFGYYDTFDAGIWNIGRKGSTGAFFISNYSAGPETNVVTINTSNNVGIGTTSPSYKLDVAGTVKSSGSYIHGASGTSGNIIVQSGGSSAFWISTKTDSSFHIGGNGGTEPTGVIIITNTGNVGIGTNAPQYKLHVSGGLSLFNSSTVGSDGNSGIRIVSPIATTHYNWMLGAQQNVNSAFEITPSTAVGGTTFSTPTAVFTATGNVGIGTTSPDTKFSIVTTSGGQLPSSGTTPTNAIIRLKSSANNAMYVGVDTASPYGSWIQVADITGLGTTYPLSLNPNGGNVGIGTTSPGAKLHIQGNVSASSFTGSLFGTSSWASNAVTANNGLTGGTTNYIPLWTSATTQGSSVIYQTSNNIGIGTINPGSYKLDVAGIARISGNYLSINDQGYLRGDSSGYLVLQGGSTATNFNNSSNGATLMTILNGGNVGIGTTSPTSTLTLGSNVGTFNGIGIGYAANSDIRMGQSAANNVVLAWKYNATAASAYALLETFGGSNPLGIQVTGGNVGIGTISPSYKLDVAGTLGLSGFPFAVKSGNYNQIYEPAGNTAIYLGNATDPGNYYDNSTHNWRNRGGGTYYMVINSSGNVGIGTTNPLHRLQLSTAASIAIPPAYSQVPSSWTRDAGGIILAGSETSDGSSGWRYGSRIMTKDYGDGLGASWDVLYNGTWTNDALFISGRSGKLGYVGIGSTNPLTPLYVVGNIQTTTGVIASTFWTNTDIRKLNASTAMNFKDSAGNIEMIIDGSGRVGIGTTSPSYKLDVNGGVRLADGGSRPTVIETGGMIYSQGDTGGWAFGHHIKGSSGTDRGGFGFYGGVNALTYYYIGQDYLSPTMVIQSGSSGNVGIGTTSPSYKLDVNGNVNANGIILGNDSTYGAPYKVVGFNAVNNGGNRIFASTTTSDGMFFAAATGRGFAFRANGGTTDHVIINPSGNVGIATTSPQSILHVAGTVGYGSIRISPTSANGESAIAFFTDVAGTDTNDAWVVGHSPWGNTGDFAIGNENNGAGGNVRLLIEKSGNVGIGTTTPSFRLDVSDSTVRTGRIYRSFQSYTGTTNNLVRTWDGVLVAGSDSSGADVYTIIDTGVPQDSYMMGGFTIDWFENYSSTNAKTQIKLSGYWNPEGNGGFIGWEYTSTNPTIQPTIQVARNSSTGNTAFILSHFNSSYAIIVARDLWLGYNSGADTYGTGWTIQQAASTTGYTNFDTVVSRTAQNTLTISSPLSGTSYNGSAAVTIALASGYGDTQNPYASKTGNTFLAAPNGSTGAPSFRAIVAADIPTLNQNTTGTASNITAYTINQNLGTGNSPSFVTITSTQATGTAPFTVASTTVVTNLNADLLDGQHGSYYNSANNLSGTIPSAVLGNSTVYVGTTGIALNRASAAQTLTGVSIDGNAAGITGYSGTYWTSNNDGVSSGLDADLLDGQHGSYYTTAGNLSGTIPSAVLGNSTVYVGTTAIALNRSSASQTLTGVSIDGNAATVSTVAALGAGINYNTDRTVKVTNGVAVYSGYSAGTNRPTTYDVAAQFIVNGQLGFEIVADWIGTTDTPLYVRSLRDCCQNWSSWSRILTDDYNPASSLSGTIPSAVLGNSTVYIGTTAIALNRGSAGQTLTGVSIDGNAATVSNLTAVQFFNNMGEAHGTRTSFDASTPTYNFGFRYVQGSTNGPGTSGTQFYSWYIGLGNDYPATGAGSYGAMFAVDRNVSNPYLSVRYNEGNSFGTWRKIYAGYADTAGTAVNITAYTINQNLGTGNSPTFAGLTVDTNTLYVDAGNDRVGIGTTSPNRKLQVGNITPQVNSDPNATLIVGGGIMVNGGDWISFDNGYAVHGRIQYNSAAAGAEIAMKLDSYYGFDFQTRGGGSKVVIRGESGNMGIGLTAPSGKLSISGGTETHSTAKVIGMTGTGAANDNQYNWAITSENDVNWGFRVSNKASGQYYTDVLGGFSDGNNRGFRVINKSNATETVMMFINSSGTVSLNGKEAFVSTDTYLRINQAGAFTSGIWMGSTNMAAGTGYWSLGSNGGTTSSRVYIYGGTYDGNNVIYLDGSTGDISLAGKATVNRNIASPVNYYSDVQMEIRATTGTAGIGLHRSGYSHVGIYHDSINQIKFNMNSGTVTMDATIGTVLGTGNYNSYSPTLTGTGASGTWSISITGAAGSVAWSSISGQRTLTRDNAGLRGDAGARSGFFETSSPTNYYSGASSWQHLIEARHTNDANNYAMQFAGSFFDQFFYARKTNDSATTAWSRLITETTSGQIYINGLTYAWPTGHGSANAVLTNNGSGTLSWSAAAVASSTSLPSASIAPTYSNPYGITANDVGKRLIATGSGGCLIIPASSSITVGSQVQITTLNAPLVLNRTLSQSIDSSFSPQTLNSRVDSIAVKPSGKILIGGSFLSVGSPARNYFIQLNNDGTIDNYSGPASQTQGASQVTNSTIYTIKFDADRNYLIGGNFTSVFGATRNYIARLTPEDTLDRTFDPNVNGSVRAIVVLPNRKILIGGGFSTVGGVTRNGLARLNSDGTLDTSFNASLNVGANVYGIAIQSDEKIVICGSISTVGGQSRLSIARINSDGTLDTGFDTGVNYGPNGGVYNINIQSDGKIVFSGTFTQVGTTTRNNIARFNSNATLDTGYNPNVNNIIYAMDMEQDDRVVIGGTFSTVGGTARNCFARLNTDGTLDTLSTNYQSQFYYVWSLLAHAGKILVGSEAAVPGRIMRLVNYVTASNTTDSLQSPIQTPIVLPQYASITLEKITSTTWNIVSSNL